MIEIQVERGESIDSALQRFQQACSRAGVTKDMRRSLCFDKKARRKRSNNRKGSKNGRIEIDD